jgi:hypothetical protein
MARRRSRRYGGPFVTDEPTLRGGDSDPALKRVRIRHFQRAKQHGIKITGLTSYDCLSASIFDEAGHRLPAGRRLGRQHRVRLRHDDCRSRSTS